MVAAAIAVWRGAVAAERADIAQQDQYRARLRGAWEALSERGIQGRYARLSALAALNNIVQDCPDLAEEVYDALIPFIRHLEMPSHAWEEFTVAQGVAYAGCDAMRDSGEWDEGEVGKMESMVRATAQSTAIRTGIRVVR